MNIKFFKYGYIIGISLLIAGAVGHSTEFKLAKIVFALGAVIILFYHIYESANYKGEDFRIRRLYNIGVFSSILLPVGAYTMFIGARYWVPCLLLYSVITIYRSIRS